MAINKITAPAVTPAAVADYTAQNNLLAALALAAQGAARVSGSNVLKGAVFLVGGSIFLADADTAISGSASDYVKLTVAVDGLTLTPSFVADLTGVTWSNVWNGYYDAGGNLYEFDEAKACKEGRITAPYTRLGAAADKNGRAMFLTDGTWRVPAGVTRVYATGIGGGGNGGKGGNAYNVETRAAGGGGGSGGNGAWCIRVPLTTVPGTVHTVQVGIAKATLLDGLLSLSAGGNGGDGGNASSGTAGSAGTAGTAAPESAPMYSGSAGLAGEPGAYSATPNTETDGGDGGNSQKGGLYNFDGPYGGGYGANSQSSDTHATAGAAADHYGCGGGGGGGGGTYGSNLRAAASGGAGMPGFLLLEW